MMMMWKKIALVVIDHSDVVSDVSSTSSEVPPQKTLSIYRIHPYRLAKASKVRLGVELQIGGFISLYNESQENPYRDLEVSNSSFSPKDNFGFNLMAFQQVTSSESREGQYLASLGVGSVQSTKRVSLLLFYFRRNEAFAVPSGNGWQVIKRICDFSFPLKVATRTLNPDGIEGSSRYRLFGPETTQTSIHREKQSIQELVNGSQVKMFSTSLSPSSSLYQLGCFQDKTSSLVDIGFRYIRPHSQLQFGHLPMLLDHLSVILRGDETYQTDKGGQKTTELEQGNESFDALKRAKIRDKTKIKALMAALSQSLQRYVRLRKEPKDFSLVIAPQQEVSFQQADEYSVNTNVLDHKPRLRDVLPQAMADIDMVAYLKQVEIWFRHFGVQYQTDAFQALRGEVVLEGCQYYLINGSFFPADDLRLSLRFEHMLSRCLVNSGDCSQLEDWPITLKEGPYNESFLRQFYNPDISDVGYIVGDRILVEGCELFDVIKVTPDTLYLYAVKEGLNGSAARAVCGQIREAAARFRHNREEMLSQLWGRFMAGGEESKSEDNAYRQQVKGHAETLGETQFKSLFDTRKLVFVAAMAQKPDKSGKGESKVYHLPEEKSFSACVSVGNSGKLPDFYIAVANWISEQVEEDTFEINDGRILFKRRINRETRKATVTELKTNWNKLIDSYTQQLDESDTYKTALGSQLKQMGAESVFNTGHHYTVLKPQKKIRETVEKKVKAVSPSPVASNNLKLEIIALEETLREFGFGFALCQIERTEERQVPLSLLPPKGTPIDDVFQFFQTLRGQQCSAKGPTTQSLKKSVKKLTGLSKDLFEVSENPAGGDCLFHALEGRSLTRAEIKALRKDVAARLSEIREESLSQNAMNMAMLLMQSFGAHSQSYVAGIHEIPNHVYADYQRMPGMYAGDDEIMQYCAFKGCEVVVVDCDGTISSYTQSTRTEIQDTKSRETNLNLIQEKLNQEVITLYKTPNHFVRITSLRYGKSCLNR